MKDPLQVSQSPYDILGLDETATRQSIMDAFREALVNRVPAGKASDAQNRLKDPKNRAMIDIFRYHKPFLNQLLPSVVNDPSKLLNRRMEVTTSWENISRKLFPNYPSIHSLAVLWYWWVNYEEEKRWAKYNGKPFQEIEGAAEAPNLEVLWSNTIAYWTMVISSNEFWKDWLKDRDGQVEMKALKDSLESHLTNRLQNYDEKYLEAVKSHNLPAGNWGSLTNSSLSPYRELLSLFGSEMNTVKNMRRASVTILNKGQKTDVFAGRLILERFNLLDDARKEVEKKLSANQDNKYLKQAHYGLSEYWRMAYLIDASDYTSAIEEYEGLAKDKQTSKEARSLVSEAYREEGIRLFGEEKFDEAFDRWEKSFKTGQEIEETAANLTEKVTQKANAIKNNQPDEAVNILDKALAITKKYDKAGKHHENIKQQFGSMLKTMAINITNETMESINKLLKPPPTTEAGKERARKKIEKEEIPQLKKAQVYLKRSVDLGNQSAKKDLKDVEELIKKIEQPDSLYLSSVPEDVLLYIKNLMEKKDFNAAIDYIEKSPYKKELQGVLAQVHQQRAFKQTNEFIEAFNKTKKGVEDKFFAEKRRLLEGKETSLASIMISPFIGLAILAAIFTPYTYVFIGVAVILVIIRLVIKNIPSEVHIDSIYGYTPTCEVRTCKNRSKYKYGETNLCSAHSTKLQAAVDRLKSELENERKIFSRKMQSPLKDLEKANRLEPGNQQLKQSLDEVKKIINST